MNKGLPAGLAGWWLTIACSLVLAVMLIMLIIYVSTYFREDYTISAFGQQNLSFRVFYLENTIFPYGPIPPNLDFLMSYTDFIEIDSSFSADFSREMHITYSYHSEKKFIIRPIGVADHRLVFQNIYTLAEASGSVTAKQLSFSASNDGTPGGSYTIFPKEHIDSYFKFVYEQARQMLDENVVAVGFRGFTGELQINFTYIIRSPEFGIYEVISHGYRLPITTELFTIDMIGTPNFSWQTNLAADRIDITLPMAIIFVLISASAVYGIFTNMKQLSVDPNPNKREASTILKKYSDEIVIYDKPANLSRYESRVVQDFYDLVKLAINLNKHIMCYNGDDFVQFAVVADEFLCLYVIHYNDIS